MPSDAEGKERLPSGSDDEMHVQILLLLSELFRRFIWHARNRTEDCFVIDPMDHSSPQPASMPAGDFSCKGVIHMLPVIDTEATALRIDQLRLENNLSVRDIQKAFGFSSPQAVYGWLRAKSIPSIDNLVGLASLLHTSIDNLIVTMQ